MQLPPLTPGAQYYTPDELATWLKVSTQTIRNWTRTGELEGLKVGKLWRYKPEAVRTLVANAFFKAGH